MVFVLLDPKEQCALHEYFLCADQPTETGLHAHYVALKAEGSSLSSRGGKAYAELMRYIQAGEPIQGTDSSSEVYRGKVLNVRPHWCSPELMLTPMLRQSCKLLIGWRKRITKV